MFDSPKSDNIKLGHTEVLKLLFQRIVKLYFETDRCSDGLSLLFDNRQVINENLTVIPTLDESVSTLHVDEFVQVCLSPRPLLGTLHVLQTFVPKPVYACFIRDLLAFVSNEKSSVQGRHDHLAADVRLSLLLHLASHEWHSKRHSHSQQHFEEARRLYEESASDLEISVHILYCLRLLDHRELSGDTTIDDQELLVASETLLRVAAPSSELARDPSVFFLWREANLRLATIRTSEAGDDALNRLETVVSESEKVLGEFHPLTACCVGRLADYLVARKSSGPKRIEDQNVAIKLYLREQKIYAGILDELQQPFVDFDRPMALSKAKMAYSQACLRDITTAFIGAEEACALADSLTVTPPSDLTIFRCDNMDSWEVQKSCRKKFLQVLFVKLMLVKDKENEDFEKLSEWLIPSLNLVLGEGFGEEAGLTASCSESRLLAIRLLTKAIVSLASKSKDIDFNPKELQRKCIIRDSFSSSWFAIYRELLMCPEEKFNGNFSSDVIDNVSTQSQKAAMDAILETFKLHTSNPSRIVKDVSAFINSWVELKVFDKSLATHWLATMPILAQNCLDKVFEDKINSFAERLKSSSRPLVMRSEESEQIYQDLKDLGIEADWSDAFAYHWRRPAGFTSFEKRFLTNFLAGEDLVGIGCCSDAEIPSFLPMLPFLHAIESSLPSLQGVVLVANQDRARQYRGVLDALSCPISITFASEVVSSPVLYQSNSESCSSSTASSGGASPAKTTNFSRLPADVSATSLATESSNSTFVTMSVSTTSSEFRSASSTASHVTKSNKEASPQVIIALPSEIPFLESRFLTSIRILLLDEIRCLCAENYSDENNGGSAENNLATILRFVSEINHDAQLVALDNSDTDSLDLDDDVAKFIALTMFRPQVSFLPPMPYSVDPLPWKTLRLFHNFTVPLPSWGKRANCLRRLIYRLNFHRVLVISRNRESVIRLREAFQASNAGEEDSFYQAERSSQTNPDSRFTFVFPHEESDRVQREDQVTTFLTSPIERGVIMVTSEIEVDIEQTLINSWMLGLVPLIVFFDRSQPEVMREEDLNDEIRYYCLDGQVPVIYFTHDSADIVTEANGGNFYEINLDF